MLQHTQQTLKHLIYQNPQARDQNETLGLGWTKKILKSFWEILEIQEIPEKIIEKNWKSLTNGKNPGHVVQDFFPPLLFVLVFVFLSFRSLHSLVLPFLLLSFLFFLSFLFLPPVRSQASGLRLWFAPRDYQ